MAELNNIKRALEKSQSLILALEDLRLELDSYSLGDEQETLAVIAQATQFLIQQLEQKRVVAEENAE